MYASRPESTSSASKWAPLPIHVHLRADQVFAALSFAAVTATIHYETDHYVPLSTYLTRMPVCAVFTAQVAKLQGVLSVIGQHSSDSIYFFYLFIFQAALQALLAMWAILAAPARRDMRERSNLHSGYVVRL